MRQRNGSVLRLKGLTNPGLLEGGKREVSLPVIGVSRGKRSGEGGISDRLIRGLFTTYSLFTTIKLKISVHKITCSPPPSPPTKHCSSSPVQR